MGFGMAMPLHRRLHPLSLPSQMEFRHRWRQYLDTQPQVNPVKEVAMDAWIISMSGRRVHATSVVRSSNRPKKAVSKQSRPTGLQCANTSSAPFRHVQPTATSTTSEAMELADQDHQIGRVRTRYHRSECTGSIYLTHTCSCYWV